MSTGMWRGGEYAVRLAMMRAPDPRRAIAQYRRHAKVGCARPGARMAIAGVKHPPAWLYPLRLYRRLKARAYVTTFRELERPWSLVESFVPDLCVSPVMTGTNYCARGSVRR